MVRFSDLILRPQDNGFIQERGVVAGTRVGVAIVVPVFLAALVAVFLVVLVLFFGCYLGCSSVPGQELDSCVVVWFSFLLLFWLALSLLSWFLFWSLLLCSWGPGTRIGSCMVVSVPLSYDFGCYFLHLMKHR